MISLKIRGVIFLSITIIGLLGLLDRSDWITNTSYRQTIHALGQPNADIRNWTAVYVSVFLLLFGVTLFALMLAKQKKRGSSRVLKAERARNATEHQ